VASFDFVFEYLKQPTFKNIGDIHGHSKFAAHLTTKQEMMIRTARFRHVIINAHMKLKSWH